MELFLYNTLTKIKEKFIPIDCNLVKMYVCGPTVYDVIHLGNARSIVVYDLLYRVLCLLYRKDHVKYIRNITDIDEKINFRAKELSIGTQELAQRNISHFHEDSEYLNCLTPNLEPKVSEHIPTIIEYIQKLLNKGYAYISSDNVYFSVEKDINYGAICGRSTSNIVKSRLEKDENKKNPEDFILWKTVKEDSCYPTFNSPWGRGSPGWHIECSSMSYQHLGSSFDIHGGGIDLIFPHHTNEIAQSYGAFGNDSYAKFWVHNGYLKVNGEKMSKSLGNFITVQDLRKKNIPGEVVRYFLLSSNYKNSLNFTDKSLHESYKSMNYLYKTIFCNKFEYISNIDFDSEFILSLLDDLNISKVFSYLFQLAKRINKEEDNKQKTIFLNKLRISSNLIGLLYHSSDKWFDKVDLDLVENLIAKRKLAKQSRDWKLSDEIRKQLLDIGIVIEDQSDGTTLWYNKVI